MAYTLRPHQAEMMEQIESEITFGEDMIMVDAPPAYGKSLQMAEVARKYQDDGVIILINITALLDQIAHHLEEQDVPFSILKADRPASFDPSLKVQLVMAQTLHARVKNDKISFDHNFKIYQQDEGHRENPFVSKRTKECLAFLKPEIQILYSGTPYDNLGFKFSQYEYLSTLSSAELQNQGYLCPIRYYVPKWSEQIDYSKVKSSSTDYNTEELNKIINTHSHLNLALNSMNDLNAQNKKTLVFCSNIEQAQNFTKLLKDEGYLAEAYYQNSPFGDRILNAFRNDSTFNESPKNFQDGLFENSQDSLYPERKVNCLVSINKLGIGFDCPNVQLGVQLRPTKVRSLYIQQAMRLARVSEGKQFAEYLDIGQTISRFGFHTDVYNPPSKTDDRSQDAQALDEANNHALEDLTGVLTNELEEITREIYNAKLEKVNNNLKENRLSSLKISELAAAFEVARTYKQIISIACVIYTYKYGQPVSKKGFAYDYKPSNFWGTSSFGDERFHVPYSMEEYFNMVPEHIQKSWIKALRTRCRNIIKEGLGLYRITGFIKYMHEKYLENLNDQFTNDYIDRKKQESEHFSLSMNDDIDDDEIPF